MGRTACTEPQCLYRGALNLYLHVFIPYLYDIYFYLLKPTGYVMNDQFNIQQLYALPALCLCVLYLSENRQRLVPLTQ